MAHRKGKITIDAINKLRPGEALMDTEQPGFGVRCQSKAVVYFVRKYVRGQRHFETIGEHGTGGLTATTARERASRIIMAIRDGLTPAERRAREKAMPTVTELADQWLEVHVDVHLKPGTQKFVRSTLKTKVIPQIGRVRVDQLQHAHVASMHRRHRTTPTAANRAVAIVSKLMSFAEREGHRPPGTNPARNVDRYPERKRECFLSIDDFAALGVALSARETRDRHSTFARAAIGMLLLSGMRLREVLQLRWTEVDLARGLLFLRDSKTGAKPVILGKHAIELLSTLPRQAQSPWVFPSSVDPAKPMYDLKKAWSTVTRLANLNGVRIHDLRHSFASVAAGSGGSLPMIGRLLGHTQTQTTARYAHLANDPARALADVASAKIAAAIGRDGSHMTFEPTP